MSAVVENPTDTFIIPSPTSQTKCFFAVIHISTEKCENKPGLIWLMVNHLFTGDRDGLLFCDRRSTIQWIQLTLRVRKVGKLYLCTDNCASAIMGNRLNVAHDETDKWIIQSEEHGFLRTWRNDYNIQRTRTFAVKVS